MMPGKPAIVALASMTLLTTSIVAQADYDYAYYTNQHPALECYRTGNLDAHGASQFSIQAGVQLVNTGPTFTAANPYPCTAFCPLQAEFAYGEPAFNATSVAVNVSHGWATTSSCLLVVGSTNGGLWVFGPNSVTAGSAMDTVNWTVPDPGDWIPSTGAEVQCTVPSGAGIWGYSDRDALWFDWVSW